MHTGRRSWYMTRDSIVLSEKATNLFLCMRFFKNRSASTYCEFRKSGSLHKVSTQFFRVVLSNFHFYHALNDRVYLFCFVHCINYFTGNPQQRATYAYIWHLRYLHLKRT